MSDYRRHKKGNYTCIDNHVFKDNSLSMKAKGLLTQIYSLPDNWDYSVRGLSTLFSDGRDAVNSALQELIEHGYIIRTQKTNQHGKFDGYEYDIYEDPQTSVAENPFTENPITEKSFTENQTQLNTNISNTDISNTKELDISMCDTEKPKRFVPPTYEEVQAYCEERNNDVDPQRFVDFYKSKNWMVGRSKMVDWKACVRTWERKNNGRPVSSFNVGTPYGTGGNEFTRLLNQMEVEE